jgi:catechol-2,3-dioxygenase
MSSTLHHLGIHTADPAALAAFYGQTLGMTCADGPDGAKICAGPDRRLVILEGVPSTLAFAAYAFEDRAALDAQQHRIEQAGQAVLPSPSPLLRDGAFSVTDPDGTRIVFGWQETGAHTELAGRPARLQHFVMASTNGARIAQFYEEVLGFTVSDRVYREDGSLTTCFLRSSNEHHSFAVFQAPQQRLDHHCYETSGWMDIRDWGDHFAKLRIPVVWGPGRHGPGDNLFIFIADPDGNSVELSAELEIVAAGREAGAWPHEERTLNLWGRAPLRS